MELATRLAAIALAAMASCGVENVELAAEQIAIDAGATLDAPVECGVCELPISCEPAPNGTECANGSCLDGACVGFVCPSGERFVRVEAGENHTCALGFTGNLYCWGKNDNAQLGLGDLLERPTPTQVVLAQRWESVASGWKHTCGQRNGLAWCWGDNGDGELGVGDQETPRDEPTQLAGDNDKWSLMVLGHSHSCALGRSGDLWCWGSNSAGQLGLGDLDLRTAPNQLTDPEVLWQGVAAGGHHSCAVDWDGGLWCFGDNADGRLGLGDESDRSTPTRVAEATSWTQVAGGGGHTCALDLAGALHCWGRNSDGEVGVGADGGEMLLEPTPVASASHWSSVSTGDRHSCAVSQDSTLWCWGRNDKAQLGLGDLDPRADPVQLGVASDWSQVSAGKRHTCGLRSNGALYCWGLNDWGQLGVGDLVDRDLPTTVCPEADVEP